MAKCLPCLEQAVPGGLGDEELDVAVFRFTLGIPGFDDSLTPRVVGILGAVLLLINHIFAGESPSLAQMRAEALGVILSSVCIAAPSIENRLKELTPGKGRRASSATVPGTSQAFLLETSIDEQMKQELAWASFALLRNTNSCTVLIWHNGRALVARGALPSKALTEESPEQQLGAITEEIANAVKGSTTLSRVVDGTLGPQYLPDNGAMASVDAQHWGFVGSGIQSVLLQRLESIHGAPVNGMLMVMSDEPRSLSQRDRTWAAMVAEKLAGILNTGDEV
eukprot:evm.model.scf_418.15 EVM.evm.TU.scf_418.15   scf_418:74193-77266(+)